MPPQEVEVTLQEAKAALRVDLKIQSMPPMKKDVKERWLTALRSGKYKQGTGFLRQDTNAGVCHCCLGVLAEEELGEQWVAGVHTPGVYCLSKTGVSGLLADASAESLHLGYISMHALSTANDRGLSFEEIADAIEECL